jgi:hypothetical protein
MRPSKKLVGGIALLTTAVVLLAKTRTKSTETDRGSDDMTSN